MKNWTVEYMVRERKGDYLAAVEQLEASHEALMEAGDAMYRALAHAIQVDPDDDAEIANLIGGGAHTLRDWKAARKMGL